MTPLEVAKYLFERLIAAGLTTEGACAILGNVQAESGFVPNNLEDSFNTRLGMSDEQYTAAVDNGSYTNFTTDGCGYGLAQWTYGTRKEKFLEYIKAHGKSIADLDGQINFLIKEFQEDFSALWSQLKKVLLFIFTFNFTNRLKIQILVINMHKIGLILYVITQGAIL